LATKGFLWRSQTALARSGPQKRAAAPKDKEAARQPALQLFPRAHALLARKKDHSRAEAALLVLALSEEQLQ
jgi:hypothetical protein